LKNPADVVAGLPAMQERARAAGLPNDEISLNMQDGNPPGADVYYRRYPLFEGYKTGSKTGEPVAPLLGSLTGFDGGATDVQMGLLNYFLAYSDHVVGYRFVPRGLQETDIQVVWMVHADAQEGRDYSIEDVSWLWHVTSLDDERIIRHNQEGVNSHFFQPGPLADMEYSIRSFYDFYLHMIGATP
jgi:Rieske 2Fe-2S family protein